MAINISGTNLIIAWPVSAGSYTLMTRTNLITGGSAVSVSDSGVERIHHCLE